MTFADASFRILMIIYSLIIIYDLQKIKDKLK
jgi:hypothetical protein